MTNLQWVGFKLCFVYATKNQFPKITACHDMAPSLSPVGINMLWSGCQLATLRLHFVNFVCPFNLTSDFVHQSADFCFG